MPANSLEDARDAVCAHLKAQWDEHAPAVNEGVLPEIDWPNVERPEGETPLENGNVAWARFSMKHSPAASGRSTLGAKGNNQRLTTYRGVVTLQIFVPSGKRGLASSDRLGMVALNAFEGESVEGVVFRNVAYREIGPDGAWYQANVTAEFEWDARR